MQRPTTLSSQLPLPSHPPVPVVPLNASNLELLATSHEKSRVQDFVASQTRHAKAQANEGRAVRASWDISTPEKEKMNLHKHCPSAGFETPILKPRARAAQTQAEPNPEPPTCPPPRVTKLPVNKPGKNSPRGATKNKEKQTSDVVEAAVPHEQQRGLKNKSTTNKSQMPKAVRKERRARSDTDEEHLARLMERRERKRARLEIMNPRKAKADTRDEKENETDIKSGPVEKKKQKIPAGLALMHGFSSTSVGKNRLTMEPPPNFGVFNKGRASAKIKVDESKRKKYKDPPRVFSENRLLNSKPAKSTEEHCFEVEYSETSLISSTDHESSSSVKAKKISAVQVRKTPVKIRRSNRQPSATRFDNEAVGSDTGSRCEVDQAPQPKPTQSRSPTRSAPWVIEQDGCSLPSTSSDVSVPSAKSNAKTAFLDVRTAAWSRILKHHSLDGEALLPPKNHENPQTASSLPITTIVKEVASKALPEFEGPASIGPWESASQLAQGTLPPQEQTAYSRFFALPRSGEPGFALPTFQLADQSLNRAARVESVCSDHSADAIIDEPLVHGGAKINDCGGDPMPGTATISTPAHTPSARESVLLPDEAVSVLQTSSLDSIERALLGVPEVTYGHSQIRRRSRQRQTFSPTKENMRFGQYGLDRIGNHLENSRPLFRDDGDEPGDASPPSIRQYSTLSLRGEDGMERLEGDIENMAGCHEYPPGIIPPLPEFANHMAYTEPSTSDEWQDEGLFVTNEDIGYETIIGAKTSGCCDELDSISIVSADRSAPLAEDDVNRTTKIHLWDDEAWPREEAVGRSVSQGEASHLTAVQKVEQDVAKKLKGHWFPHKF